MEAAIINLRTVAQLYEQGEYALSLELALDRIAKNPDDGKMWELCGIVYEALQRREQAIDALERAALFVPLSQAGQYVLATCYLESGHRETAKAIYRHLFTVVPLAEKLLAPLAGGLGRVGELPLALETCRRAAELELDHGQPLYGMAYYMDRLGYPAMLVVGVLRKAVALEPERLRYRLALAKMLARQGLHQDAYNLFHEVPVLQLANIRCSNCLKMLIAIFQATDDYERLAACQKQLDKQCHH